MISAIRSKKEGIADGYIHSDTDRILQDLIPTLANKHYQTVSIHINKNRD